MDRPAIPYAATIEVRIFMINLANTRPRFTPPEEYRRQTAFIHGGFDGYLNPERKSYFRALKSPDSQFPAVCPLNRPACSTKFICGQSRVLKA